MKILLGIFVLLTVLLVGFFALNSFIYNEKQGGGPAENLPPSPERPETPPTAEGATPEVEASNLEGTSWTWVSTELPGGKKTVAPSGEKFVLSFPTGRRVESTTDCNSLSGMYVQDGEVLSFTPFMSTKMFCEGSVEAEYVGQLALTNSHTIAGDMLRLNLNRDAGVMVFTRSNQ